MTLETSSKTYTVLITGATGSFGSAMTRHLLSHTNHKIRCLARSESKLSALQASLPSSPRLTFILADIRDSERLDYAFQSVDLIFHAAALKTVPFGELHTGEFVKTNIAGTLNVIASAIKNSVSKTLFISTDKAVEALNAYGRTKAVAESCIVEANMLSDRSYFSSVRGGNIWGSRGSVVERWLDETSLNVNNPEVTRFHLAMPDWLEFCFNSAISMHGGEIFVPNCRAWRLGDLALAFTQLFSDKRIVNLPSRDGDKNHEFLISSNEASRVIIDTSNNFIVEPNSEIRSVLNYKPHPHIPVSPVPHRLFSNGLSSAQAERLTVDQLKRAIENGGMIR